MDPTTVPRLLQAYGTTYAEEAGITLRDKPAPLFQLLVLTLLSSTRIRAHIAVAAARELFAQGWRTPERMQGSTWQQRVDALGRGGYRRYDESTATKLDEAAGWLRETHGGDLRRVRPTSHDGVDVLLEAIEQAPRIGPAGSRIFAREVQLVWPEVAPYFDERALHRAGLLGLPTDPAVLARAAPGGNVARLATALVRADLDDARAPSSGSLPFTPGSVGYEGFEPEPGGVDVPKRKPGPSVKDDHTYEALRDEGASKEKAARIANAGAASSRREVARKGGAAGSYDDWTKVELVERAREIGIEGRSRMNKSELIEALRSH